MTMKTITVAELKERLSKDEILLIDVREPEEHQAASIEGACLIPLGELSLERLPATTKPIVIHCRSDKRSSFACALLLATNPTLDLSVLEGGIIAWQQAGYHDKNTTK